MRATRDRPAPPEMPEATGYRFGVMRRSRFHKICRDLGRALACARTSPADRRLLQYIRERTWGTNPSDAESSPCPVNVSELSRLWGVDRAYLGRQLAGLVADKMVSRSAEGYMLNKDVWAWAAGGRIEPVDVELARVGYGPPRTPELPGVRPPGLGAIVGTRVWIGPRTNEVEGHQVMTKPLILRRISHKTLARILIAPQ